MPRARRKPADFQTTDTGPDTPAQRHGAVYEVPKDAPPGYKRKGRQHPLEAMAERGLISGVLRDKGLRALELYERTQLSPGWLQERVDKSADPSAVAVMMVAAAFDYAEAVRDIPDIARPTFNKVVENGQSIMVAAEDAATVIEGVWRVRWLRIALDSLRV